MITYEEIVIELEKIEIHDNAIMYIDYYFDNGHITEKEWAKLHQSICDADLL